MIAPPRILSEWATLEAILVGRADSLCLPRSALRRSHGEDLDEAGYRAANGMARTRCGLELGRLHHLLRKRGVEVLEVGPLAPGQSVRSQLFVRDLLAVVAGQVVPAPALAGSRSAETAALADLFEPARPAAPAGARLEGGDVLVDWPRVFVGVDSHGSNRAGADWLAGLLGPAASVVPVSLDPSRALHLDYALALVGPGLGIVHRAAFPNGLPAPLSDYRLVDVDRTTFAELGINGLCLDPATLVLQSRHRALGRRLQAFGIDVIGLEFDQHVALGGGFRCATAAWRRAPAFSPPA